MDVRSFRPSRPSAGLLLAGLACVGCISPVGTTAKSFLRHVRENPDPNVRHQAYQKLASPDCYASEDQKALAAQVLADKYLEGKEPAASRAVICRTLGELQRPEGRPALTQALNEDDSLIRAVACRALGKIGNPEDLTHLTRIMTADRESDCRIAAIEGLGEMKTADPRVAQLLVETLEHDDPAVRLAALRSLRTISDEDLGTDPKAWREWVEQRVAAGTTGNAIR